MCSIPTGWPVGSWAWATCSPIEQAEKTFDAEQSAKAAAKLAGQGGEFGLADFLQQMQMVRKMGPLSKVFEDVARDG